MNKYDHLDTTTYSLGMSLTIEALKHKADYVKEVLLSEKAIKNKQLDYLLSLCDKHDIPIIYDDKTIDRLSNKENCYCIGIINKYETKLIDNNHILLYEFNDYGDLGTILRSCVSFNFKDIILINSDIDYFDPRCIRASMGSIFLCNIKNYKNIDEYQNDYHNNIYCFTSKANYELSGIKLNKPYSLLIAQDNHILDNKYENSYYIKHNDDNDISLSIRTSIILEYIYDLNLKR